MSHPGPYQDAGAGGAAGGGGVGPGLIVTLGVAAVVLLGVVGYTVINFTGERGSAEDTVAGPPDPRPERERGTSTTTTSTTEPARRTNLHDYEITAEQAEAVCDMLEPVAQFHEEMQSTIRRYERRFIDAFDEMFEQMTRGDEFISDDELDELYRPLDVLLGEMLAELEALLDDYDADAIAPAILAEVAPAELVADVEALVAEHAEFAEQVAVTRRALSGVDDVGAEFPDESTWESAFDETRERTQAVRRLNRFTLAECRLVIT